MYLNNFQNTSQSLPFSLPAGTAHTLKKALNSAIITIHKHLIKDLLAPQIQAHIKAEKEHLETLIQKKLESIKAFANEKKLDLVYTNEGIIEVAPLKPNKDVPEMHLTTDEEYIQLQARPKLYKDIEDITTFSQTEGEKLQKRIDSLQKNAAKNVLNHNLTPLKKRYKSIPKLHAWLESLQKDILEHIDLFINLDKDLPIQSLYTRYDVNIITAHDATKEHPDVILEPNPTYENLIGAIKYSPSPMGPETNFMMIHGGSLHKANGGILVIRAESLAQYAASWAALKQAIRDQEVTIEEPISSHVMMEAPDPLPIPLDLQIIIVGSASWYYKFFFSDKEFKSYFKIKADIDTYFHRNNKDINLYGTFLQDVLYKKCSITADNDALGYIMGYSCRMAGTRERISTAFDTLIDILVESAFYAKQEKNKHVNLIHVHKAIQAKSYRNDRIKDLTHKHFEEGVMAIKTDGTAMGQINALTVQSSGSEGFGAPSRITARTYMGRRGVLNIEEKIDMGGPIQQKGVLILEGYMRGLFSQEFPISFSSSITFEQNYGGVEGDSASLAELCAILATIADLPLRQDIAVTGSINQLGIVQAVGGVNEKIEGFFYTCQFQGLTGKQGVIIPETNRLSVALLPEVSDAILKGKFHIWCASEVSDALSLLTGCPAGTPSTKEDTNTLFGKVYQRLKKFDDALNSRGYTPMRP